MDPTADLKRLAESGDAAAQYRLAAAFDRSGDRTAADLWLARAAASGHPGALTTQAVTLLSAPPDAMDAPRAAALLKRASDAGSGAAARRLAVLKALGLGVAEDWEGAVALVRDAAAPGRADAVHEARALDAAFADTAARETLRRESAPRIATYAGALTAFECDYVIAAARPLLQPSAVVDSTLGGARAAAFRTSDGAALGILALDLPLIAIWRKLCRTAGVPPERSELMGVLRYRPGEEYRPHHDYLPEDAADYSQVKRSGQRVATLLTPLNAGYEGGETVFPRLGLRFRLPAGDSLLFENAGGTGAPIEDSQHAGAPVTSGEKWMLTLWFRSKPFWFWR